MQVPWEVGHSETFLSRTHETVSDIARYVAEYEFENLKTLHIEYVSEEEASKRPTVLLDKKNRRLNVTASMDGDSTIDWLGLDQGLQEAAGVLSGSLASKN